MPPFGDTSEKVDMIAGQLASAGGPDPELKTEDDEPKTQEIEEVKAEA